MGMNRTLALSALLPLAACAWSGEGAVLSPQTDHVVSWPDQVTAVALQVSPGRGTATVAEDFGAIDAGLADDLVDLVRDADSYVPELVKQCRFRPAYRVTYVRAEQTVVVSLDPSCRMWRIEGPDTELMDDYDPVADTVSDWVAQLRKGN